MKEAFTALPRKKKIVLFLVLLCLGITVGYLPEPWPYVTTPADIKEAKAVSRSRTETLAHDILMTDRGGDLIQLKTLYNKKPVLLYFWMDWSGSAQKDFPLLEEMYRTYGRDIYFVPVCLHRDANAMHDLSNRWPYDMPVYTAGFKAANECNVYEVPMAIMIMRGGTILDTHKGQLERRWLSYTLEKGKE